MSVVGVVESAKDVGVARAVRGILYVPHWAQPWSTMTLLLRVESDAQTTLFAVRREIRNAQPGMPIPTIHGVDDNLRRSVAMTAPS